jgi:hypothetical protein
MKRFLLVAALLLGVAAPASAVPTTGSPSTRPVEGQWFAFELGPGASGSAAVVVDNPAAAPARVRLSLADIHFDAADRPTLAEPPTDAGSWASLDATEVDVPAHGQRTAHVTVKVPSGAEPGDHVGAIVAETTTNSPGGGVGVVARVATRLYVTVPGAVRAAIAITTVRVERPRAVTPRWANVIVTVRNTGTVRVQPTVTIGGARAHGSSLLLSHSSERYVLRRSLPFWGGSHSWPIEVDSTVGDRAGPSATANASTFVFPWLALALLLLAVLVAGALWQVPRRRRRQLAALAAQVAQLESRLSAAPSPGSARERPRRTRPLHADEHQRRQRVDPQ